MPLQSGTKECADPDWLKIEFRADDFRDGDGIGIRSEGGLAVVDLDCPEAIACADALLPPTGAVWGRPSTPRAKRLYRAPGVERRVAHSDPHQLGPGQKATLVELRVKHQDVAPPSSHPSGETLRWDELGDAAEVDGGALARAVRMVATTALLARHWNPPGQRHEWCLALAGTLRQLGLTQDECLAAVGLAAGQAGDGDRRDREAAVRGTYRLAEGEAAKSLRALIELSEAKRLGEALRKVWGAAEGGLAPSGLDRLNARHAVVFMPSGELTVISEDRDGSGRPFLRYSALETIRQLYPEVVTVGFKPNGQPITQKLGQAWLDSPRRRSYEGIEMAPNGRATPGYYNLWRGFSVEPKAGSWELFRGHVRDVVCSGDPELERYVVSWMAQAVQDPGHPGKTAIALRGGQGTGKSTFARWFGALFGPHFLHLDSTRQLTGNFNAHLHNAVLVFADEAAWPGDKAGLGALRRMVTEETLTIERKGQDIFTVPNSIHMILASNEEWVVPAALDERRFAVLDVARSRQNDRPYFQSIERELFHGGGLAAMLHDLLVRDIGEDLHQLPHTKALLDQKDATAGPQLRWWRQELEDGDLWREDAWLSADGYAGYRVDRDALYDRYLDALERAGGASRWTERGLKSALGRFLAKVMPAGYPRTWRANRGAGARSWIFANLAECRQAYEVLVKAKPGAIVWPED